MTRRDRPLSLAQAQRETDFPFPASAQDIHYATYQDFMAPFEFILRFDAPPADCEATIPRALAWHEQRHKGSSAYKTLQVTAVALPDSSYLHPVAWWDGATIQEGAFAGEDSSHKPTIWVDSRLGRFYYRSTD